MRERLAQAKERFRQAKTREIAKIKEMPTLREKWDYIWEYYKMFIIGFAIVLFVAGNIINNVWINPPKQNFVNIVFWGIYIPEDILSSMEQELSSILIPEPEMQDKYVVTCQAFATEYEDPQMVMAVAQKFVAMIAGSEVDILISTEHETTGMLEEAYFFSLADIPLSLPAEVYKTGIAADSTEILPYSISMRENNFLQNHKLITDDLYLSIIANTQNIENTVKALQYIFQ